jgi:hypothetical protein
MKKSDLHREYARVIDLCEGTSVPTFKCVRSNEGGISYDPEFNCEPESYTFAVALVENRPVFVGDTLYDKFGTQVIISPSYEILNRELFAVNYSWNPPKPDPYAELKQAQKDGKRIAMESNDVWFIRSSSCAFAYPPECYKIIDDDIVRTIGISGYSCFGVVTIKITKSGLDGKISVELA